MEIEYYGRDREKKPAKPPKAQPSDDAKKMGRTAPETPLDAGKKRILIVDDDIHVIESLRPDLEAEGYSVTWATDPTAAKVIARQWKPDLLVTDVMMPELNGFAMVEGIFSSPDVRKVPVIFISGSAAENVRPTKREGLSFQFALLKKPFDMPELCRLVRQMLAA